MGKEAICAQVCFLRTKADSAGFHKTVVSFKMKLMRILLILAMLLLPCAGAERVCSAHDGDTFKLCNGVHSRVGNRRA